MPMWRPWNHKRWLDDFDRASKARDHDALHELRAAVFQSTVDVIAEREYFVDGDRIGLDDDQEYADLHSGSIFYSSTDEIVVPADRRGRFRTEVRVDGRDCLETARDLAAYDQPPAVLNMASRRNPGGGVRDGSGAQEENLFRRTNLLRSLYQFVPYADEYEVPANSEGHRYPIERESGGIYSPPAWVFRSSEADGYAFLADPYKAAFITVPAIPRPDTYSQHGGLRLTDQMARATRRKIRAILRIGATNGHPDLVLGAFGCGAFKNPPRHMAELFRETLSDPEFDGVFRSVVFAILNDHNAARPHNPRGNYLPFKEVLDPDGVPVAS